MRYTIMKSTLMLLCLASVAVAFSSFKNDSSREEQNKVIDAWHHAAAVGDSATFFGLMSEDAVYLGTDLSERWDRASMARDLGKYFRGRKAWHFEPYDRHYYDMKGKKVMFDESLKTWMGPCRATGVLAKVSGKWKIAYYNLSVAVPNAYVKEYIKLLPSGEVLTD